MVVFGGDAFIPDLEFAGYTGANVKVNDVILFNISKRVVYC
jgi:hypothetical protein